MQLDGYWMNVKKPRDFLQVRRSHGAHARLSRALTRSHHAARGIGPRPLPALPLQGRRVA
eukprot:scaffold114397_cov28-Tisochrysis_lutea.AAC.3